MKKQVLFAGCLAAALAAATAGCGGKKEIGRASCRERV